MKDKFLIIFCLCLSTLLVFEYQQDNLRASSGDESIFDELQVFTDVLAIVQSDYVSRPESNELVKGAIKGMLATLDPHSGYLDPKFYDDLELQTKGEFGGLGIEITIQDGLIVVVSPMEDSPAAKVGMLPGDAIVKIEDKFTKDYSLVDAIAKLRGKRGTTVNIGVQREGVDNIINFAIVRDIIKLKSVKKRYLTDGYGYVRLTQFMEDTGRDLDRALAALKKENNGEELRGLIIDLRNNPGGLLTQAIKVTDTFLKEGVIVYTDGRLNDQKQKFYAKDTNDEPDYPIVVLINGGSASASEIVSGALKDHGRALILGTQSFGKGSVQTVNPLRNGGALTLTTALYYTKSGNSIQAKGIQPDIVVEEKLPEVEDVVETKKERRRRRRIRESELPGAIKNPGGGKDPGLSPSDKNNDSNRGPKPINPEETPLAEWMERDTQFQRGFDLLKTFNIFQPEGLVAENISDS